MVVTSSIKPSRSTESTSSAVVNVASGLSAQVTLTHLPDCEGSIALLAFGQSLRWTDTP